MPASNAPATLGAQEVQDAIQDHGEDANPDDEGDEDHDEKHPAEKDFEINDSEDIIPQDLDGWHWAFSDSESEAENQDVHDKTAKKSTADTEHAEETQKGKASGIQRHRVAEEREEYIECLAAGLLIKPAGSTLGVHPGSCTWRASYPGSKHYGRSWGTNRTPKKALLEVLKLILQDHVNANKGDKLAKGQLARVTKAWTEA